MLISYVCTKHPIHDGRIQYKISPSLTRVGHEVINIHPNTNNILVNDNIKIVGYIQKKGFFGRVLSFFKLYKTIKKIKPNLLIAPEPDSLLLAFIYKKFHKKTKVIFDCHEAYEIYFNSKIGVRFIEKLLNRLVLFEMNFIVKRIETVISVNQTMTKRFEKYNSSSYFIPSIADFKLKEVHNNDRNGIVYFGQFGNDFQKQLLLDTAVILKTKKSESLIRIIGGFKDTSSPEKKDFIELIKNNNLEKNIQLIDWLPKEQAFNILSNSIAGIMRFDSWQLVGNNALPNKIFEYMASGMAVICCDLNSEQRDIILQENCGISIKEENSFFLSNAILQMEKNKEDTLKMGRNSLLACKNKYNWDNYGKILSALIDTMEGRE
jgi:glycosyltransferase involved in cell wall biosynthesis